MGFRKVQVATIPAGSAVSNAVYPGAGAIIGIQMPAAWTAGALSFQGSFDGVTFAELTDTTGALLAIATPAAGEFIELAIKGPLWVIIRSGTAASPVNQVAAAIIQVVVDKSLPGAGAD
jgi:hypothetical protein